MQRPGAVDALPSNSPARSRSGDGRNTTSDPKKLHNKVTNDVYRAARLIENGLTSSWPP